MRKRFLIIILIILPLAVSANIIEKDGLWYDLDDSTTPVATVVSSQSEMYEGAIVIPENIEYGGVNYTVTSIGYEAFFSTEITRVVLPNTLNSIGDRAFASCWELSSVVSHIIIPFGIGQEVFFSGRTWINGTPSYNKSNATLYVPVGFKTDYQNAEGWDVFAEIIEGDLRTATVGGLSYSYVEETGVASVVNGDYSSLSEITIPSMVSINGISYSVENIEMSAFKGCSELNKITLNEGLKRIKSRAFSNCYSLNKVDLPSTLTGIYESAFSSCNSIGKIAIPEGCTTIGRYAFRGCSNLEKVVLPRAIEEIGDEAFSYCENMTAVVTYITAPFEITQSVFCKEYHDNDVGEREYIKNDAVLYVPVGSREKYASSPGWSIFADIIEGDVKEIKVGDLNYWYVEGNNYASVVKGDYSDLRNITIPSSISVEGVNYSVKSINVGAFSGCYEMESTILSEGIETIGKQAFYNCGGKFSSIPSTIKSIGDQAFFYCRGLERVEIPEGCTSIGRYAFNGCENLKSVRLSSTLINIGESAFAHCSELAYVISRILSPFDINQDVFCVGWERDGEDLIYNKSNALLYVPINTKSSYELIPGWNMFGNIVEGDLKEATYGDLRYVYVEGSGSAIVVSADYSSLKEVIIPSSVIFDDITYAVKEIGAGAFQNCTIESLFINEGVELISRNAFKQNYGSLKSVVFPKSLKKIDDYAFYYCYGISKLEIPEGVTIIGNSAFQECGGVKSLKLPSTLTVIGEYAFASTWNLNTVISRINNPFVVQENTFCKGWTWDGDAQSFMKSEARLYVPIGSKDSYQTIKGWNMFVDIIEGELREISIDGINYSYVEGKDFATVITGAYTEMTSVTIPSSIIVDNSTYVVTTISKQAFENCEKIKELRLNEGLEVIEDGAFRLCHSLSIESIPSTLVSIGDWAFENCNGITNLDFPTGFKSVGKGAFATCWLLEQVEFPITLESIGAEAFRCCPISVIELPASVTNIGEWAFAEMANLSRVVSLIEAPFEISDNVFCSRYKNEWNELKQEYNYIYEKTSANLYIPEGTLSKYQSTSGWNMFAGIYEGNLQEVKIGDLNYAYIPGSFAATVVSGDYTGLSKVTIPASIDIDGLTYQVKEVGASAFKECQNLDSVIINNGIEIIGKMAFYHCINAVFGDLPSSIMSIGDESFRDCHMLKTLVVPEGAISIGYDAFASCSGIIKVVIPSTIISIGERAFASCYNLSTVISRIKDPFEIHKNVFGNDRWDESVYQTIYLPCGASLYVPEGTKAKYEAFEGWRMFAEIYEGEIIEQKVGDLYYSYNTSARYATVVRGDSYSELSKVEIPGSVELEGINCLVKNIASRAFSETPITSLVINEGVESIGKEAFSNCRQLATVTLPSSLSTIDDAAFRDCSRLGSVVIPSGVNTIGMSAFGGCKVLKSLDVAANNEKFESRGCNAVIERESNTLVVGCLGTVIPESVTAIGQEAFINLDIKELNIPSSVKTIGENAFNSCHQLTEVVLPEGLETLSNTAFHSCSGLTLIELPKSLKTLGGWAFQACVNLVNVVSNIEDPKGFENYVFGEDDEVYSRATLWVPKGMVDTYKKLEGWGRFLKYDELLRDTLPMPTVSYNGRYMTMQIPEQYKANIYYSTDGSVPTIQYSDTITISNLGTIQAVAKRFGSYTVDTTRYEVTYLFDGVTARTTSGGLLAKCFEWSGTDKVEMLDVAGTLNDEDFGTIRGLSKLNTLNMAASEMTTGVIPAEAFANTKLQWYVSPYTVTGVGANIFKGCDQLAAITWNSSSVELPEDVAADVANPNMLVYAKAQAMIPYTIKNVVVNGFANNIILSDSVGNNNFYCPEEFIARRISYTHNYTQTTKRSVSQGWETIALPFTVSKITHEKNGALTPIAVEGAEKPFWLYELGDNGLEAATQIRANIPYLICMPNDDDYGDEYMQGGRVTFSAQNATITTSSGTAVSHGDRQFVPTYQRVAASSDVYVLNVNEAVGDNPMGSAFIQNLREVRPFEAYSVHSTNRSRIISVSSLGGGDATGIYDMMQNSNGEFGNALVRVYSLSGKLVKEGRREDVLRTLPKGLYIINGKKIIK